jgi:vacuolar-type H+-ATPase subunit H
VRFVTATLLSCILMALTVSGVQGQTPVTSISLRPDQIGLVKTAQALSTRISFPDPVKEIICGDLYDPATGRGSFVVQRAENDVFIKPVVDKGLSNLFVKTGERSEKVYNFDLAIVSPAEAVRVMNVIAPGQKAERPSDGSDEKGAASAREGARVEADEIIRKAKVEADKILSDAEQHARSRDLEAETSAQKEIERRFIDAMMLGVRESKVSNPRIVTKKVIVTLDPHVLTFSEKSYLRYTIQNTGGADFTFGELGLEDASGSLIAVEIIQNKPDNKVRAGESITGIIAFDPKVTASKGKVTLFIKGGDQSEVARLAFL